MKKIIIIAAVIMAFACTKEKGFFQGDIIRTPVTITATYGSLSTKVNYGESGSAISATWESDDQIYVIYDGQVSTLSLSSGAGDATATFTGSISHTNPLTASSVLACYVKDKNNSSALTISGGSLVYSDAAFTNQDGTLASAAKCNIYSGTTTYGDGTNLSCSFGVSTSMCKFTFKEIGIDSGESATVSYMSGDITLASASITVGNGDNLVYLAVPSGSYSGVQKVTYSCASTTNAKNYVLSSSQASFAAGHTYSKSLMHEFTVSSGGKKVLFAPGNLQYKSGSGWRFAAHQWDYIGVWNTLDWIDLFGWGTWGTGGNPTNESTDDAAYTWSSDFSEGTHAGYSDWYTPAGDEFAWLLGQNTSASSLPGTNCRYSTTVNGTENARFAMATINTDETAVAGLIIFPDNYAGGNPAGVTWDTINDASKFTTTCTTAGWKALESYGCVFLPASGYRNADTMYQVGLLGRYFTQTAESDDKAYTLYFTNTKNNRIYPHAGLDKFYGTAVRLVRNAE